MRIHHLNCGTMCPRPAALTETSGSLFARGRLVCHCLLVESKAGLLLVDTGLGTEDVRVPKQRLGAEFVAVTGARCDPAETALAQLGPLGFKRADVRHILPTHLDLDHAGGLGDFPEATVHILEKEHDAATARRTLPERNRYKPAQWAHKPRWQLHAPSAGERWFGFEGVRPLAGTEDEVLIIPLYGHTRGHAGIAVRTDDGWLLHAGDAYFHHAMVHGNADDAPLGLRIFERLIETDRSARRQNRERLRTLAQQHGGEVRIVCAHDASEFDRSHGGA